MSDFTANNICSRCRAGYSVELRRMRSNLAVVCPTCGFPNGISEEQAIAAQRLLERLELEGKERKVA
jgi:DNA-directed RNA polymerase subunit RPC12/RpoP